MLAAALLLAAASGRIDYASAELKADASFADASPFAHALRTPSFSEWTRLDFATRWREEPGKDRSPHLILRRTVGGLAPARIDYAAADSCPGLQAVAIEIEHLKAPPIDAPGFGLYEPPPGVVEVTGDGTGYRVWGPSTRMSVRADAEAGRWMERTLAVAARCWRANPPAA